jgi:23S rRNA-/tRNA-specific pseudouridylate synthase
MLPMMNGSVMDHHEFIGTGKICHVAFRKVELDTSDRVLLEIKTDQGYRHMIRALLGCHGAPIAGDVRYGSVVELVDRSVALHARRLSMPLTDKLRTLVAHHSNTAETFSKYTAISEGCCTWTAPLPPLWRGMFGISEQNVQEWEKETSRRVPEVEVG